MSLPRCSWIRRTTAPTRNEAVQGAGGAFLIDSRQASVRTISTSKLQLGTPQTVALRQRAEREVRCRAQRLDDPQPRHQRGQRRGGRRRHPARGGDHRVLGFPHRVRRKHLAVQRQHRDSCHRRQTERGGIAAKCAAADDDNRWTRRHVRLVEGGRRMGRAAAVSRSIRFPMPVRPGCKNRVMTPRACGWRSATTSTASAPRGSTRDW